MFEQTLSSPEPEASEVKLSVGQPSGLSTSQLVALQVRSRRIFNILKGNESMFKGVSFCF